MECRALTDRRIKLPVATPDTTQYGGSSSSSTSPVVMGTYLRAFPNHKIWTREDTNLKRFVTLLETDPDAPKWKQVIRRVAWDMDNLKIPLENKTPAELKGAEYEELPHNVTNVRTQSYFVEGDLPQSPRLPAAIRPPPSRSPSPQVRKSFWPRWLGR